MKEREHEKKEETVEEWRVRRVEKWSNGIMHLGGLSEIVFFPELALIGNPFLGSTREPVLNKIVLHYSTTPSLHLLSLRFNT
jgi:hypothetical protein